MLDYIEERVLTVADYIIEREATVRSAAKRFGISKSTVHKDMRDRLRHIDPNAAQQVDAILERNKAERHLRGGMATHRKYKGEGA